MKHKKIITLLMFAAFLFSLAIFTAPAAHSQLILVNMKMKIVKVERENNRLQTRVHEKNNDNVQYVLIDGNTRFSKDNKVLSFDEAWKTFHKDQIIRVQGGYTMGINIKAKTIYM